MPAFWVVFHKFGIAISGFSPEMKGPKLHVHKFGVFLSKLCNCDKQKLDVFLSKMIYWWIVRKIGIEEVKYF